MRNRDNNMFANNEHLLKILLIGNSGVGKSCLLMRYVENNFTTNFFNTIGVDFKMKTIPINDREVKLQIWDTAGQERFRTITCNYYRGAHGVVVVYDITDRESFDSVKNWMVEIEKYAQENVNKLLIGNKCDQTAKRQVSHEEGADLARQLKIDFQETSAKEVTNVDTVFKTMAENILNRITHVPDDEGFNTLSNKTNTRRNDNIKNGGCCG